MEKINLFWAVVWGLMFVLSVVAIFWNPSHFITMVISFGMCAIFTSEYIRDMKRRK